MPLLKVLQAKREDVFSDTVRVHKDNRTDSRGKPIPSARVCRISVKKRSVYAIVRGNADAGQIIMDDYLRERLGVEDGKDYHIKLAQAGFLGSLRWGWSATDPAYRIAAQQSIISLILGVIGLFLGLLSLKVWP